MKKENTAEQKVSDTGENNKKRLQILHWRKVAFFLVLYDLVTVNVAYAFALFVRFDFMYTKIPQQYMEAMVKFAPIYSVAVIIVFAALKLYNSIWRYIGLNELFRICIATLITFIIQIAGTCIIFIRMPLTYYILGILVQLCFTVFIRVSYRVLRLVVSKYRPGADAKRRRVMIVGAGEAGKMLLREIRVQSPGLSKVCCIIDDNPNKHSRLVDGVSVVGGRNDIPAMVTKYGIDQIIIALPSAKPRQKKDIINICKETHCEISILPGISELIDGKVQLSQLREVSVEELLGREPIKTDLKEVMDYVKGRTVLITGGGGSIGSELARQVALYDPKRLILFDSYENSVYDIQLELESEHPELELVVLIGSVRDRARIRQVMREHKPEIVYHAAAHKHVPLMEDSPREAVKNNVLGTYETARAASDEDVERFVLISTDKAVNPTNIMGATKRLCEMIVQSMNEVSDTSFVAVRFGNVLGSNGSVIPIFRKQIKQGGPVTVTDPEIIRYFMTIPEAVSLVLQAGAYAKDGEIFLLNMGEPVKIDDLARNMIKLAGYEPDVDIRIEYIGLRPGEKKYEELLMDEEGKRATDNELIFIGTPAEIPAGFLDSVEKLRDICMDERSDIRDVVRELVPTYRG